MTSVPRPFRFGVMAGNVSSLAEWRQLVEDAERLGYSSVCVPDHLGTRWSPVVSLASAAMVSERIRISSLVLHAGIYTPTVLARDLATLQLIAPGRLEVGLGAGWDAADLLIAGLDPDAPGTRIARFAERARTIRHLLAGEAVDVVSPSGRRSTARLSSSLAGAESAPLLIGGSGRLMLELAAREADIVGICTRGLPDGRLDHADATFASTRRKVGWVRQAAGPRYDGIELNLFVSTVELTSDVQERTRVLAASLGVDIADVQEMPNRLIGTEPGIVDRLHRIREELDISYLVIPASSMAAFATIAADLTGR